MADLLDEKRSTYAEWEKETEPRASVLFRISEILEVPFFDLLGVNSTLKDPLHQPDLQQLLTGQEELRALLERIENKIDRLPSATAGTPLDELRRDLLRKDKAVGKGK